jgi:hypothetical protein
LPDPEHCKLQELSTLLVPPGDDGVAADVDDAARRWMMVARPVALLDLKVTWTTSPASNSTGERYCDR